MKKLLKVTSLSFLMILINLNSFAQESVFLNAGEKASFSGYLVPEITIKSLRNDSLDAEMYRKIVPLKDNEIKLLTEDRNNLAKTLVSTTSLSVWEKIGWFGAGIVITGFAIKTSHEIYK